MSSIRNKLFFLIASVITMIMFFMVAFNEVYFEKYFLKIKKNQLFYLANEIKDPRSLIDLSAIEEKNNIKIYIINERYLNDIDVSLSKEDMTELFENPKKFVFRLTDTSFSLDKELTIITSYNKNQLLIISTPFSSVKEPVNIITSFHLKIVLTALVLGYVLSIILSRIITASIIDMGETAKRVAKLDFSQEFKSYSKDEIGILGENLNIMSAQLKDSIEKLQEDIEKERKIDKMRKEFISSVSHELKTPIAIINNYCEGLKEGIADDKETADFYLDIIMEETENMNKLVQSLLFLSRAERGFITFNSERFNIKEIIENEVKRAENLNTEDKKVIVDIKDKFFVGDKEQLTAVIKNLVENSFKYVEPEGEIIIKSENNRFTIGNTSHISEKEIENIWLPFYRADKARDRKLGTGLGLAIVKEILESHKLKYGVYKEDDKIIFWFEGGEE
ncbi:HAMP domain-containing protein [Fusobacterium perfoetens]|uniref:sensor histidine kinase n=1 Tax=Fusobacterium perfoetens TaxID=852 RepID=UPI001F34AE78|nr:histidine kinase dimerization/phospho-acceptor domain-containing protein [Fusobacterium perfoetens]MCF2624848.1 HAMP domain-containing protein [Fusobacterium perfoetens]